MKPLPIFFLTGLILVGCAAPAAPAPTLTPVPAATAIPLTPTPTTFDPAACTRDGLLREVDALLAGSDFDAHYLSINGMMSLSVWMVDPDLDPAAEGSAIQANSWAALRFGALLGQRLMQSLPCLPEVFEVFNPMIVDREFNSWYVDVIPLRLLDVDPAMNEDELADGVLFYGLEIAYLRREPVLPRSERSPGNCGWPEARAALGEFLAARGANTAAYLIVGQQAGSPAGFFQQAMVQISWPLPDEPDLDAVRADAQTLSGLLACLHPPLDILELYLVDESGRTVLYGAVTGEAVRAYGSALPADTIDLHGLAAPSAP